MSFRRTALSGILTILFTSLAAQSMSVAQPTFFENLAEKTSLTFKISPLMWPYQFFNTVQENPWTSIGTICLGVYAYWQFSTYWADKYSNVDKILQYIAQDWNLKTNHNKEMALNHAKQLNPVIYQKIQKFYNDFRGCSAEALYNDARESTLAQLNIFERFAKAFYTAKSK
jgi:hypothetical protein